MMPENSNRFNGDDQPLRPGDGGNDDRLRDASSSDAAADNARENERTAEASRVAVPSYQRDEQSIDRENEADTNPQPPTTQGSEEEIEENLSGTTNLTLDQLKKVRDPGGFNLESEEPEEPES
ncbi:hypothetical protein GZH53_14060 [Flavihumibacter sp. R14]|nr:hypothetical protein [Flavihumibacter soli]